MWILTVWGMSLTMNEFEYNFGGALKAHFFFLYEISTVYDSAWENEWSFELRKAIKAGRKSSLAWNFWTKKFSHIKMKNLHSRWVEKNIFFVATQHKRGREQRMRISVETRVGTISRIVCIKCSFLFAFIAFHLPDEFSLTMNGSLSSLLEKHFKLVVVIWWSANGKV